MSYRLPNGTITSDLDLYGNTWNEFGLKVASYFPGYTFTACDPMVVLSRIESHTDGTCSYVGTFSLPIMACNCLISGKEPDRVTREDLHS